MSNYDIRPKSTVWAGSANECPILTFSRTCHLGGPPPPVQPLCRMVLSHVDYFFTFLKTAAVQNEITLCANVMGRRVALVAAT